LVFCIALVVVTIPEGLKFVETITLSSSLGKLFKKNSLVRSLGAPEMMARCTDICVETTGCLTNSKIDIEQIYMGGQDVIKV
jgi:Ca2+-transporting ATPase